MKANKKFIQDLVTIALSIVIQQGCANRPLRSVPSTDLRSTEELKKALSKNLEKIATVDNVESKRLDFNLALPRGNKNIFYRWHNQPSEAAHNPNSKTIAWLAVSVGSDQSYHVDIYNRDTGTICLSCDPN